MVKGLVHSISFTTRTDDGHAIPVYKYIQILVRLIADYRIKLHAPLIGLVNRQIFWILILRPYSSGGTFLSFHQPPKS